MGWLSDAWDWVEGAAETVEGVWNQASDIYEDASCYGATWTPKKGDDFYNGLVSEYTPIFTNILSNLSESDEGEINSLVRQFFNEYASDYVWLVRSNNPASGCTKDTLKDMTKKLDAFVNQKISEAVTKYKNAGFSVSKTIGKYSYDSASGEVYEFDIPQINFSASGSSPVASGNWSGTLGVNLGGAPKVLVKNLEYTGFLPVTSISANSKANSTWFAVAIGVLLFLGTKAFKRPFKLKNVQSQLKLK